MELNKVLEGFTVSNTLVIKAQVQVIRCAVPFSKNSMQVSAIGLLDSVLMTSSSWFCNFAPWGSLRV